MKNQRVIFIGDVHGCFEELQTLLSKLNFIPGEDRLIFVGDLVNKGPFSLEVLELVFSLHAEVVIGNHERGFLQYLADGSYASAGFAELKRQLGKRLEFWRDWLNQLPTFIEDENFLVVHAGLVPNQHPANTKASILTTIRTWDGEGINLNNSSDPPWYELYHGPKPVIFGHWAKKEIILRNNAIGLDTGCVYGNKLTAAIFPGPVICQVSAKQVYEAA
ncbi:MAG: metallophosphoesterase [SAR324 cluster bacterium]|nr:metallophosphoesterase [SAR324 cluster bacterium]